jgi:hypothetical protein
MILAIIKANYGANPSWIDNDNVLKYLIPTAVALIVFILGIIASWLKDNIARRRETKNLKNVILYWSPNLKAPVELLANSCSSFSQAVATSNAIGAEGIKFHQLSANKLESISLESMIKTFITNSTGKNEEKNMHLFDMVSVISFLEKKQSEIMAKYNEHYVSANDLLHRWNKTFVIFSDANIDLVDEANKEAGHLRDFNTSVEIIRRKWDDLIKANPQNTKISYSELIMPFDNLLIKYIDAYGFDHSTIGELSSATQDLKIIYTQWEANKNGYAAIFSSYASQLKESFEKLEQSVAYFRNTSKIKRICS